MSTALLTEERVVANPLQIQPSEFQQKFNRQPFEIRHSLCDHPLFELPRILELARTLPEVDIEYNAGALPVNQDPTLTPRNGLSPEETIRRIEECQSWMVLKRVQKDPEYGALLNACLDEIRPMSEAICPGMTYAQAFIFLTSPGSVTPYHIDPEHNFLLQVRGSKTVHLFNGNDRSILSDEDLEGFYGGRVRNLVLADSNRDRCWTFDLQSGYGLHFPVTFPHWVQNGPEVSVSFSITFRTPDLEKRRMVYACNRFLRQRGLKPSGYGKSAWRDSVKYQTWRTMRKAASLVGKSL